MISAQVATIANTLLWPLAAGAAVVIWSMARARRRAAAQAQAAARSGPDDETSASGTPIEP